TSVRCRAPRAASFPSGDAARPRHRPRLEIGGREGPGEEVALRVPAAELHELLDLLLGLDALGDDVEVEALRDGDDGLDDLVALPVRQPGHERAIDLHGADREAVEVAEGR